MLSYKLILKVCFWGTIFNSCQKSEKPKPHIPKYPYEFYGFTGTVVDCQSDNRIKGCRVSCWGKSPLLDTISTFTDSNGYFKLITSDIQYTNRFNLLITHPNYGVIENKLTYLNIGTFDNHFYIAQPPFWVKFNFSTLQNLKINDYFELDCDLFSISRFGKNTSSFDSSLILKGSYNRHFRDYGFLGTLIIYRDSILNENRFPIEIKPWDTTYINLLL